MLFCIDIIYLQFCVLYSRLFCVPNSRGDADLWTYMRYPNSHDVPTGFISDSSMTAVCGGSRVHAHHSSNRHTLKPNNGTQARFWCKIRDTASGHASNLECVTV